jgi:hypothetical protein
MKEVKKLSIKNWIKIVIDSIKRTRVKSSINQNLRIIKQLKTFTLLKKNHFIYKITE